MKKTLFIMVLLSLFLVACNQPNMELEGYKDEKLNIQTDADGISKEIYDKGKELFIKANEAYETDDLEMYRDMFVEVNNYFVDNHPNPTLEEYKILASASDMWNSANSITKTNDDQEKEELYKRLELSIKFLDETLDEVY